MSLKALLTLYCACELCNNVFLPGADPVNKVKGGGGDFSNIW